MAMQIKHKVHKHTQTLHTYIMPPHKCKGAILLFPHISTQPHKKEKALHIRNNL